LNPNYRTTYLEGICKSQKLNLQVALQTARGIWETWKEDCKPILLSEDKLVRNRRETLNIIKDTTKPKSILEQNERILGEWASADLLDELEQWIKLPATKYTEDSKARTDVLAWWLEDSQLGQFPLLSQLAVTLLSIPAMSAEPERVFSGARRTISWERAKLGAELIEWLICYKHFLTGEEEE
jgi:hypothetical protein